MKAEDPIGLGLFDKEKGKEKGEGNEERVGDNGNIKPSSNGPTTIDTLSPATIMITPTSTPPENSIQAKIAAFILPKLAWIPKNSTWSGWKPVIRCAIAAWIASVLFVIPRVERWIGQASFLILIASFLSPPSDPFVSVFEREFLILGFTTVSWAWSCLGIKLASLARVHHDTTVTFVDVLDGRFVEAAPSVILGVFIGVGSFFFLYVKAKQGPGPYLFASIFAFICLDINLTTAALFPFPYYEIGRFIIIPLILHTCIALSTSLLIFPCTISYQFTTRLQAVLGPLGEIVEKQRVLLATEIEYPTREDVEEREASHIPVYSPSPGPSRPGSPVSLASSSSSSSSPSLASSTTTTPTIETPSQFTTHLTSLHTLLRTSEDGLIALAASSRLLPSDLCLSRFSPADFNAFRDFARRLGGRVQGMTGYFALVDPSRRWGLGTSETPESKEGKKTPGSRTPAVSRVGSRATSAERGGRSRAASAERGTRSRRGSPERGVKSSRKGSLERVGTRSRRNSPERERMPRSRRNSPERTDHRPAINERVKALALSDSDGDHGYGFGYQRSTTPHGTPPKSTMALPSSPLATRSASFTALSALNTSPTSPTSPMYGGYPSPPLIQTVSPTNTVAVAPSSPLNPPSTHTPPIIVNGSPRATPPGSSPILNYHSPSMATHTPGGSGTSPRNTPHHSHSHTPSHHTPPINTSPPPTPRRGFHPLTPVQSAVSFLSRSGSAGNLVGLASRHNRDRDSHPSSPAHGHHHKDKDGTHTPGHKDGSHHGHGHGHHGHSVHFPHLLHASLLNLSLKSKAARRERKKEHAVGVFESWRYMDLEARRSGYYGAGGGGNGTGEGGIGEDAHWRKEEEWARGMAAILQECCDPLLAKNAQGIQLVKAWLDTVREHRISPLIPQFLKDISKIVFVPKFFKDKREEKKLERGKRLEDLKAFKKELEEALRLFRADTRLKVLDMYKPAFEGDDDDHSNPGSGYATPVHPYSSYSGYATPGGGNGNGYSTGVNGGNAGVGGDVPTHRHLFHCYVYQYHLIQVSEIVVEMITEILRLEAERIHPKLWTPVKHLFVWSRHDIPENVENDEDDDPDIIQGARPMDRSSPTSASSTTLNASTTHRYLGLGIPRRRDPDALPPRNTFEWVMNLVYRGVVGAWGGNSLFAVKAGVISVALVLPSLFKHTAPWAYRNRWVWAVVMGQLTVARFRGDTAFGLCARIIATFAGGVIGMTMWYISTGNPFGMAAVCFVCFPFFFFVRLYCPIPPMTNLVAFITAVLVLGYSYQDHHNVNPGTVGMGWDVAWRRFVLVTVGVCAAFLASLLPPNMTLRRYHRHVLSTTNTEIGAIYCAIISYATERKESSVQEIVTSLIATRAKLTRSAVLKTNIIYEFSLRGRWPEDRYQQILDLQISLSYSLSHLMSVVKHMEPAWTRAFLRRCRLVDPDFQGDVLAVLSMISNSLRTGAPLPQITPCPLLDRFTMKYHGLDVIHRDSEEDYGLPRLLTLDTLQNEQYMIFCVGVSTAYGIMNRLDKLMFATKEIVGEQYHLHGINMAMGMGASGNAYGGGGGSASAYGGGVPLGRNYSSQLLAAPSKGGV